MILANNKLSSNDRLIHVNSIAHEGKVVVFATDSTAKIWYTVKQDGFEESYLTVAEDKRTGWEDWFLLSFPDEEADLSVLEKEAAELTDKERGLPLVRSLYSTGGMTSLAPVQLVSALGYIYVFRQSMHDTLLVDRFVLDGLTNFLIRKYDVRYKRSRQKYKPSTNQMKSKGGMVNTDSLDFKDINGNYFYEPTTELHFVDKLVNGWFSVLLLSTAEQGKYRWHIFYCNREKRNQVEATSVRASEEGLFDIRDYRYYTSGLQYVPGIIHRTFIIPFPVFRGLTATKYDVQRERQTDAADTQLLREAVRVMLSISTDVGGLIAVDFGVATDGTLSQLTDQYWSYTQLRKTRQVELPFGTLDNIKTIATYDPAPQGLVVGYKRGEKDEVWVTSDKDTGLKQGEPVKVKIEKAADFNQLYEQVTKISDDVFEVSMVNPADTSWEVIAPERNGLVYNGIVTAYRIVGDKLQVTAPGHGLENEDRVKVMGTKSYSGLYDATKIDDDTFSLTGHRWLAGTAINLQSVRRRGITFGRTAGNNVEFPAAVIPSGKELTIGFWANGRSASGACLSFCCSDNNEDMFLNIFLDSSTNEIIWRSCLWEEEPVDAITTTTDSYDFDGRWVHWAFTKNTDTGVMEIFRNGTVWHSETGKKKPIRKTKSCTLQNHVSAHDGFSVAELNIWNKALTEAEIKDIMALAPVGNEDGLMGCWRLDSILADGDRRIVYDLTPGANHGIVNGGVYTEAIRLPRKVGPDPAILYENEELFAVTENATYREQFDFRIDSDSDPREKPFFEITYKGKKSRNSEKWIDIDPLGITVITGPKEDGWYTASTRFLVPEGVSLARSFGIRISDADAATWNTMSIRAHSIHHETDTSTRQESVEDVIDLNGNEDVYRNVPEKRRQMEMLEAELAALIKTRKNLQRSTSPDSNSVQAEIDKKNDELVGLRQIRDRWKQEYDYSQGKVYLYTDLNYGRQVVNGRESFGSHIVCSIGSHDIDASNAFKGKNKSVKADVGLCIKLFRVPGCSGDPKSFSTDSPSLGEINDKVASYRVETVNGNSDATVIYNNWQLYRRRVEEEEGNLSRLEEQRRILQNTKTANDNDYSTKLAALNGLIADTQKLLEEASHVLVSEVVEARLQASPQGMTPYSNEHDPHGLLTTVAYFATARPASRLNAIQTCEGDVQVSFFDDRGCIRLLNYDATADGRNSTFEQWLSEPPAICLNIKKGAVVTPDKPLALPKEGWTIEAWFGWPLPEDAGEKHVLTQGDNEDQQIVVERASGQLGTYLRDPGIVSTGFLKSGYDMNQLETGWYHIAAVAKDGNTTFYIDGKKVGDVRTAALQPLQDNLNNLPASDTANRNAWNAEIEKIKKAKLHSCSNVSYIGNAPGTAAANHFGPLAEVRIWNVPLSEAEVEVNSKTILSGYEPGLAANYRFNEGRDRDIGNRKTSAEAEAAVQAKVNMASWWGCTAKMGNPGNPILQFDGADGLLTLPSAAIPPGNAITIGFWMKKTSVPRSELSEFSSVFSARDSNNALVFEIAMTGKANMLRWSAGNPHAGSLDTIEVPVEFEDNSSVWVHWAFTKDVTAGEMKIFRNGYLWFTAQQKFQDIMVVDLCQWGRHVLNAHSAYIGQIAHIGIWNRALDVEEIPEFMYRRLTAQDSGLFSYYPLNESYMEGQQRKVRNLSGTSPAVLGGGKFVNSNSLPVGGDAVVCNEYSTVGSNQVAMMRRFFAIPATSGIALLPDKRIEELELKWVGNGQFEPTLLGYIEGAPPIPSENLTWEWAYNGATSVELTVSEDVEFKWERSQDVGLGGHFDAYAGLSGSLDLVMAPGGVGVLENVFEVEAGLRGNMDLNYQMQNESSISSSSASKMTDKLELFGTQEQTPNFPNLGKRFIPKNVGYALVVSALSDVFITRLSRSKRMIGYKTLPVENIPPDINTITFLINPAYTMNGSLDGMTGSNATSQRFFRDVPEMRASYGSLYPASYYRLQEAYELKQQIEQRDKGREAYFAQFNSQLIDEISLKREIGADKNATATSVQRQEDKADTNPAGISMTASNAAITKSNASGETDEQATLAKKKQDEIKALITDQEKRSHASAGFASWQTRMEDIQIRAGKRNIVNTYVWDADGGLRSETQSFASVAEHSIGGEFSLSAGLGIDGSFSAGIVSAELTAQATMSLTQTMTKTRKSSRGIELNVNLDGVESRGITDYNDYPIMPGEKVNRYRFMSFYLEGNADNFNDFFNYVVDPEWLASNSEEARALRQAKGKKANKAWRVLHRVTYVERPSLMGFGRDVRPLPDADTTTDIGQLKAQVVKMQAKLDEILNKLAEKK